MADLAGFLRNVREHQMIVEIDQGVHRSIQFKRAGSYAYQFRLNTWPGHLSISGDMGCYTFSRLADMFEFFRDGSGQNEINKSYWAEKLQGVSKRNAVMEVSEAKFHACVKDAFDRMEFDNDDDRKKSWDDITDEWDGLNLAWAGGEDHAKLTACQWTCPVTGARLDDTSEIWCWNISDYSHHFVWCLRAIVWGIKRYDLAKSGRTQADHDRLVLKGAA